ncbi:MAG: beta-galactosidase trimerization domain-containing protein [Armatimonadia bacterium]
MQRFGTLLVIILLLCPVLVLAQDAAELEVDHSVNTDFVTPHTDWATPYVQGKTRALFFVRGHGTAPREVIELKQRFDLEPQMVFWARIVDSTVEGWHGAENGVRRMERLLNQKWDAYVFLGIQPEKLPVELQYKVIKAVADGAGLVLVGVDDKRILKPKNLLKPLPEALAAGDTNSGPVGEPFAVKQGRGIKLPAQPTIEYRPGWETDYDYWQQRLGRALLWAAGKEPKLSLAVTPKAASVARATLPAPAVTVGWQGANLANKLTADFTLRRADGWTQKLGPAVLKSESSPGVSVTIPQVPAGQYHVDVVVRGTKGVEDFGSAAFTVAGPEVGAVTLERGWGEIGDNLTGKVALPAEVAANQTLVVSLRDRQGRELVRQSHPVAREVPFTFKLTEWLPMLVTVRATLMEGDQELSSSWAFARMVKRNRGQYNFVMWDTPGGSLAPYGEESLARNGVTAHLTGGKPAPWVAAWNIAWVPYTTRILAERDANGVTKPACWWDEPLIQAHVDKIVQNSQAAREHGVFVYSLGDEGDVRGSCLSPYCLAAYRAYLKQEYGDVAALNTSWGTTYGSFDEVNLSTPTDNDEAEAFRTGNFARWFDRQAFQSYSFCKLCERFRDGFRKIDPQSICGFEGAGTFKAADDLDGFVRSNTFWSPYPGTADEVVRSIAPRDFPRSNWMGYTKDANTLLEKYWRMITRGCDSVWWWRWDCIGRFHGWLSPSLDPYPAVKDIIKDTQIVREGLGDLLLHAEMQDDGIGIMFSQPSAYATKVQHSPSYGAYENDHVAWHNAIRDLGLNFRYFTDRQLRLGEVDLSKFKVIVLPLTQAMSAQETEALRRYVEGGGTLIADLRPAIYDGHVKPLAAGALDDLFGVKRNTFVDAAIVDATVKGELAGQKLETTLTKVRVDTGLAANGAKALGEASGTPLLLVNKVGKGNAILLNVAMSSFPPLAAPATPEAAAEVVRAVLAVGGASPAYQLTGAKGRLRNVEVTRWRSGDTEIVSFFRHAGEAEPAKIGLGKALQAYDLKSRKDLGKVQSLSLGITPYRAQFFVLSPQPLAPLAVSVDKAAVAPGTVVEAKLAPGLRTGAQAARVQVKLPDGTMADWLDDVLVADGKAATIAIPVAFNDPKGTYTVVATEVATGKATTATFAVK